MSFNLLQTNFLIQIFHPCFPILAVSNLCIYGLLSLMAWPPLLMADLMSSIPYPSTRIPFKSFNQIYPEGLSVTKSEAGRQIPEQKLEPGSFFFFSSTLFLCFLPLVKALIPCSLPHTHTALLNLQGNQGPGSKIQAGACPVISLRPRLLQCSSPLMSLCLSS